MFGLESLDVVLGLAFLYLTLSLVCMAVNEWIAHLLHLRGTMLRDAVTEWIEGAAGNRTAVVAPRAGGRGGTSAASIPDLVYAHPLIRTLREKRVRPFGIGAARLLPPSYIPSRVLVLAFTDVVRHAVAAQQSAKPPGDTSVVVDPNTALDRDAVNRANLPDSLKLLLRVALADAERTRDSLENRLVSWVDTAMDRLGADYKRRLRWVSLLVAFGVTIAANANSITVLRALSPNDALRAAMAGLAVKSIATDSLAVVTDSRPDSAPEFAGGQWQAQIGRDVERLRTLSNQLNEAGVLGLPIGYPPTMTEFNHQPFAWIGERARVAGNGLVGLLITTFAVSLGAPFWFDVLKRVVEIRSAGLSPTEADTKRKSTSG